MDRGYAGGVTALIAAAGFAVVGLVSQFTGTKPIDHVVILPEILEDTMFELPITNVSATMEGSNPACEHSTAPIYLLLILFLLWITAQHTLPELRYAWNNAQYEFDDAMNWFFGLFLVLPPPIDANMPALRPLETTDTTSACPSIVEYAWLFNRVVALELAPEELNEGTKIAKDNMLTEIEALRSNVTVADTRQEELKRQRDLEIEAKERALRERDEAKEHVQETKMELVKLNKELVHLKKHLSDQAAKDRIAVLDAMIIKEREEYEDQLDNLKDLNFELESRVEAVAKDKGKEINDLEKHILSLRDQATKSVEDKKTEIDDLLTKSAEDKKKEMNELKASCERQIAVATKAKDKEIEDLKNQISKAAEDKKKDMNGLRASHEDQITAIDEAKDKEISVLKDQISKLIQAKDEEVQKLISFHEGNLNMISEANKQEVKKLQDRNGSLRSQLTSSTRLAEERKGEIDRLTTFHEGHIKMVTSAKDQEIGRLEELVTKLKDQATKSTQQHGREIADLKASHELEMKAASSNLEKKVAQLSKELDEAKGDHRAAMADVSNLQDDLNGQKEAVKGLKNDCNKLRDENKTMKANLAPPKDDVASYKAKAEAMEKAHGELTEKYSKLENDHLAQEYHVGQIEEQQKTLQADFDKVQGLYDGLLVDLANVDGDDLFEEKDEADEANDDEGQEKKLLNDLRLKNGMIQAARRALLAGTMDQAELLRLLDWEVVGGGAEGEGSGGTGPEDKGATPIGGPEEGGSGGNEGGGSQQPGPSDPPDTSMGNGEESEEELQRLLRTR